MSKTTSRGYEACHNVVHDVGAWHAHLTSHVCTITMQRSFLEISKRGVWSPRRIAQERLDVQYRLLAIDFLPASVLGSAMQNLAGTLASGPSQSLPLGRHELSAASHALRQLSQVIMTQPGIRGLPVHHATAQGNAVLLCTNS